MTRAGDKNRKLTVVPPPEVKHPSVTSDEDRAFPTPLAPRPARAECTATCPSCGGSIVIVIEAQLYERRAGSAAG
jgi:hypothetical protein